MSPGKKQPKLRSAVGTGSSDAVAGEPGAGGQVGAVASGVVECGVEGKGAHGAGAEGRLRFPSRPLEAPGGRIGEGGCGGAERRRGERGERACPRGGGAGAAGGDEPGWGGGRRARSPGAPPGCAQSQRDRVRIQAEPQKAVPGSHRHFTNASERGPRPEGCAGREEIISRCRILMTEASQMKLNHLH
ncbi:uncharacterized protein LOC130026575 [Sorex fumeus]|uniref:uncharacterized protein LOC130026575 n=1 Tax=Sorex fumeus TaxID=62283 RepID=UPI0024ACE87D|nr:uncharacterized protein LOC130026575 [Sorex fumeus]